MQHVRIALLAILLMTGCRFLSDEQQVGVLKYVASTITGAVDAAPRQVAVQQAKTTKAHPPCKQLNAFSMQHKAMNRLQHVHARMQYAASRMNRAMSRIVRFEMFTASRACPRAKKA